MRQEQLEKTRKFIINNVAVKHEYTTISRSERTSEVRMQIEYPCGWCFVLRFASHGTPYRNYAGKTVIPKFSANHVICLEEDIYFNLQSMNIGLTKLYILAEEAICHMRHKLSEKY